MDIVWSQSVYIPWELLVRTKLHLSENSFIFCKVIGNLSIDASKIDMYHVFTLYVLFVDAASYLLKKQAVFESLDEHDRLKLFSACATLHKS